MLTSETEPQGEGYGAPKSFRVNSKRLLESALSGTKLLQVVDGRAKGVEAVCHPY